MQPMDVIVLLAVALTGYSVLWAVRHERKVRRFRSRPPAES
jgi:hypothetical protein